MNILCLTIDIFVIINMDMDDFIYSSVKGNFLYFIDGSKTLRKVSMINPEFTDNGKKISYTQRLMRGDRRITIDLGKNFEPNFTSETEVIDRFKVSWMTTGDIAIP